MSRTRLLDRAAIVLVARLAVGLVFVYLACMKLADPRDFVKALGAYELLPTHPPELINAVAIYMPWVELLCGLCLVIGILPRGAAFLATGMLVAFTGAVFLRGVGMMGAETSFTEVKFDCGCGTGEVYLWKKLLSNGALILGGFVLCVTNTRLWAPVSLEKRPPVTAG